MMRARIIIALTLLWVGMNYSQGQTPKTHAVYDSLRPQTMGSILADMGIKYEVERKEEAWHFNFKLAGTNVHLVLLPSENIYTLAAMWSDQLRLEVMNTWNANYLFTRLWRNPEGGTVLQLDVNTGGGITRNSIEESIQLFAIAVATVPVFAQIMDMESK